MVFLRAGDEEYYTLETRDVVPAQLLTKINSFSKLSQCKIEILESTKFEAGGYKWKVIMNINGGNDISVKLSMVETKSLPAGWEVNAIFIFFIYNHISDRYHCFRGKARRFHATSSEWGFSKLITLKSLSNGFLFEDKCVFGAEVFVIEKQPLIEKVSVLDLSHPYKGEWKIPEFSKLESICKPDDLSAGGNKWNIMIYPPNGSLRTCHVDSKTSVRGNKANAVASLFCFRSKLKDQKHYCKEEYSVETRDAAPAHLVTTIESFSMLSKHKIQLIESAEFEAGDYKWRVVIKLDGGEDISVNLCMVGTSCLPAGWEVNAMFNFFLYNHISDKYHCFQGKVRRLHAINPEWGFSKFITKESLTDPSNGYLSGDDKCVFGAEVFVINNQPLVENVSVLQLSNPYKRKWKIREYSKLKSIWKSEEFSAGGYKWVINMYPNGSVKTSDGYVRIFLQCVDAKSFGDDEKVNAGFCFCLRNKLDDMKNHSYRGLGWFSSTSPKWGFNEFKAISDMHKGFVVKDCCTVEIELSVHALQELE